MEFGVKEGELGRGGEDGEESGLGGCGVSQYFLLGRK